MKPIVILNLKSYKAGFNELEDIVSLVNQISREFTTIDFVVAPNILVAIKALNMADGTKIFLQHVDPVDYGAFTGHIPIVAVKDLGFHGVIINHSERPVPLDMIKKVVERALHDGIKIVVCAGNLEDIRKVAVLKPDYVAFEPPELIGTGISVSKAKPDELRKSVELINEASEGKSIPICGAGISSKEDVKAAFELGARGILVASAFIKARDREEFLRSFAEVIEETI